MDVLQVPLILFLVIVAPIWIVARCTTRWRMARAPSPEANDSSRSCGRSPSAWSSGSTVSSGSSRPKSRIGRKRDVPAEDRDHKPAHDDAGTEPALAVSGHPPGMDRRGVRGYRRLFRRQRRFGAFSHVPQRAVLHHADPDRLRHCRAGAAAQARAPVLEPRGYLALGAPSSPAAPRATCCASFRIWSAGCAPPRRGSPRASSSCGASSRISSAEESCASRDLSPTIGRTRAKLSRTDTIAPFPECLVVAGDDFLVECRPLRAMTFSSVRERLQARSNSATCVVIWIATTAARSRDDGHDRCAASR